MFHGSFLETKSNMAAAQAKYNHFLHLVNIVWAKLLVTTLNILTIIFDFYFKTVFIF